MPADLLIDRQYDGIREYDNRCPAWWVVIFWATAAFCAVYFLYVHLGDHELTLDQAYQSSVADNARLQFGDSLLNGDAPTMLHYMYPADAKAKQWQTIGACVFAANCATCHGPEGAGRIGPNLTDDYYKHIKTLTDIPKTIANGAAGGNMPSWKNRLHPNEIVLVAAFVASLRGKNLPGKGKIEGDVQIPPWPKTPTAGPID